MSQGGRSLEDCPYVVSSANPPETSTKICHMWDVECVLWFLFMLSLKALLLNSVIIGLALTGHSWKAWPVVTQDRVQARHFILRFKCSKLLIFSPLFVQEKLPCHVEYLLCDCTASAQAVTLTTREIPHFVDCWSGSDVIPYPHRAQQPQPKVTTSAWFNIFTYS